MVSAAISCTTTPSSDGPTAVAPNCTMTISPEKEAEIIRLLSVEKWPRGTVARQVGVHHDVVDRVASSIEGCSSAARSRRPRAIDKYLSFIGDVLKEYPTLRASRVHEMIKSRGFRGSERRTRAAVKELRPRDARPAYLLVQVLPGEQSQIDWMHLGRFTIDGVERDVHVFVQVLSWSRAIWGELVLELNTASLLRSLVRAAEYFGGVTRQWVFDNAKAVVIDRAGSNVRFNSDLVELASSLHVMPKACRPRKANEKGRVERVMRYLRDRHFEGRTFSGIDVANRELLHFLEGPGLERQHPDERGKTVAEMLAAEKPRLLPLPSVLPTTSRPITARVDGYGYVRFETNYYAAPGFHGQQVQLTVDDRLVRISSGTETIAEYKRSYGRKRRIGSDRLDRLEESVGRDRAARTGRNRLVAASPLMVSLFDHWLDEGRNIGSQIARALKLLELYGPGVFAWAVENLSAKGSTDIGALENLCEVRRRALKKPAPSILELGAHVPDRDVATRSLEDYDV